VADEGLCGSGTPKEHTSVMQHPQLAGLILASAVITLDGTATTIALSAIGRDLSAPMSRLQWIVNAPLLVLVAMLLPAGTLADRFGRLRVIRIGLGVFVVASVVCVAAWSDVALIAAKLAQGLGGALVLPAVLALLRGAYAQPAERTRVFGIWAAWTGAASAAGPLLAGLLVDLWSWRTVFLPSIAAGLLALAILRRAKWAETAARPGPIPTTAILAFMALFGAAAYLLIQAPRSGLAGPQPVFAVVLALIGLAALARDRQRDVLLPRELLNARNCLPANATTFALYFGMFGLSFLVVLYVQQVLQYSAFWAAIVLLPMSLMLLLAERFGTLTAVVGARPLAVSGALSAALGIGWIGSTPHPVPFWSHIIVGSALFGLGISLAVSALTHAAVAAVPETCAGAASGLNHAVVRAAGLVAVAFLGSLAAPGISDVISAEGFQRSLLTCAAMVAAGGVLGSALLRDAAPGGINPEP
jgi:MFS family permease